MKNDKPARDNRLMVSAAPDIQEADECDLPPRSERLTVSITPSVDQLKFHVETILGYFETLEGDDLLACVYDHVSAVGEYLGLFSVSAICLRRGRPSASNQSVRTWIGCQPSP